MRITVFTPTFNRGYIIENLYISLKKQNFKNFEWIVIDDGSTDNTEELFERWSKEENDFPIRYYRVNNGGKHRAINKATNLANGDLFFIVDSDDYLTKNALALINEWEKSLPNNHRFCGVSGNRGRSLDEIIGTTFNGEFVDATSLDRSDFNITGDKAEVFYTKILKNYKFKEFSGENFVSEATVWNLIAQDGYKIRWFNEVIYICEYLDDGLTKNMKEVASKNPKGTAYYLKQQLEINNANFKGRLSNYNAYYQYVKTNLGIQKAAEYLEIKTATLILAIFLWRIKPLFNKS